MGSFGWQEMAVIAIVALLVFGPDRMPDMARQAARFIARVRGQATDALDELKRSADFDDLGREFKAVSADVDQMRRAMTDPVRSVIQGPRGDKDVPPIDPEAT